MSPFKLLLIQPPIQDFYDTDIRLQPLGLAYLKAMLQAYEPELEVKIIDFHHGWGRRTIPIPRELGYLKDYYAWPDESPFSAFHNYYHFGADFDLIEERIKKEKPDAVGISSLFSPYYREVLQVADRVKKVCSVPVILGGAHVSAQPDLMLRHPSVDFVIVGEGEQAMLQWVRAVKRGDSFEAIPQLGYKKDGRLMINRLQSDPQSLDDLPMPDFSDLSSENYLMGKNPMTFLVTSRSCPHRCSFCSVHLTFGYSYRRRSPAHVLAEIRKRYQEGIRFFDFEDDNLTFYLKDMKELCRMLITEFPLRDVEFAAMNGISYLSLDRELLELMKQAGFKHLNLALVTSDITVRETTKRPHTMEKYLEVVRAASDLGFKIVSYQILGIPDERLESMVQTLVFAARLPVLLGASMFYLTPNSPAAKKYPEQDETDIFKARLTAMAIETEHFKREDIYTLFVTTRIINFLKGLALDGEVSLSKALEAAGKMGGRQKIGADLFEILMRTKQLYAFTRQGLKPLTKFRFDLFASVWEKLDVIACQSGAFIDTAPAGISSSSFELINEPTDPQPLS